MNGIPKQTQTKNRLKLQKTFKSNMTLKPYYELIRSSYVELMVYCKSVGVTNAYAYDSRVMLLGAMNDAGRVLRVKF